MGLTSRCLEALSFLFYLPTRFLLLKFILRVSPYFPLSENKGRHFTGKSASRRWSFEPHTFRFVQRMAATRWTRLYTLSRQPKFGQMGGEGYPPFFFSVFLASLLSILRVPQPKIRVCLPSKIASHRRTEFPVRCCHRLSSSSMPRLCAIC